MKSKILIRFDDICPTMNFEQFSKAEKVFDKYNIKPLLGVIPDCHDPDLQIETEHRDFWEWIKRLEKKGFKLAMHGCTHVYDIKHRGIVNTGINSEFAGHSYEVQLNKILKGKKLLLEHGIKTDTFFAPAHSYDENTIKALREAGFKYLSDGRTKKAVMRYGIKCLPCRSFGTPRYAKFGYHTAVFHAHEWKSDKNSHIKFENYCKKKYASIVDFNEYSDQPTGNLFIQSVGEKLCIFHAKLMLTISKIKRKIIRG